jgi:diguanylate cyclase
VHADRVQRLRQDQVEAEAAENPMADGSPVRARRSRARPPDLSTCPMLPPPPPPVAVAPPAGVAGLGPAASDPRWSGLATLAEPASPAPPSEALAAADAAAQLALGAGDERAARLAQYWACTHLHRSGELFTLLDRAADLLPGLAECGLAEAHRDLLYRSTLVACELGRLDTALAGAQQLQALALASSDPGRRLAATFTLAATLERMGDSWQAERVLRQSLADTGEQSPPRERMVALNGLAAMAIGLFHRLRDIGQSEEIERLLLDARDRAREAQALERQVEDPVYEVTIAANLGEILVYLHDGGPAHATLGQALRLADERGLKAHHWRIRCSLAEWHLAAGQAAAARADMLALLAVPGVPMATAVRARQALWRACRALGGFEEALSHFEIAERMERERTTHQLRAQSRLFVTRSEHEQARSDAQHERARADAWREHAERDALTGLANRRGLERAFRELLPRARAEGQPLALAVLDIDHFKRVNDTHGHAAGDAVLVRLAQLLRENTRSSDVLARSGGEEFVLVLPGMGPEAAIELCERLRQRVARQPWPECPGLQRVTVSLGLATTPPYDGRELQTRADRALYTAKHAGRNCLRQAA